MIDTWPRHRGEIDHNGLFTKGTRCDGDEEKEVRARVPQKPNIGFT